MAALLTTVLFSMSAVAGSRFSRLVGGLEANFFRILIATFLLGIYAHTLGTGFAGKALPFFLLSGLIGFGLGDMALYQALPRIGSRLSMILIHCLAAPMAALIEWLWLGTALTALQVACSLVILLGVAIALAPKEHLHLAQKTLVVGVVFGVIAAVGQGVGSVVSRKAYNVAAAAGEQLDGITAAYQRIWGGVLFASVSYFAFRHRESTQQPFAERMRVSWKWAIANGTLGPALGVSCMQYALERAPTGIVLPIIALAPVVIVPLSQHFENEKPTIRSLIGGLIAVAGVVGLRFSLK